MPTCSTAKRQLELNKNEYQLSQVAFLPAEGIGAHGSFFIKIALRLRGANMYISARGYTPAMELPEYRGAFRFYGNIKLLDDGRQIIKRQFDRAGEELWPEDRYIPVGSAMMCIPSSSAGRLSLEIEAGYEFNGGTGFLTPIPPTGKLAIPLEEE